MEFKMLEIKNLVVEIEDKRILNGLNLTVNKGEVAAIMGPNGSGKSTLSYVIAGKEDYEILDGEILLDGQNLLEMEPDERAAAGLFLAFQYPLEIPGVATMTFLKAALNAQRKARGESELTTPDFIKRVNAAAAQARDPEGHAEARRSMSASPAARRSAWKSCRWRCCEPTFCILDETDSGLDIDALRVVAEGVNALRSPERSFLVITHYQRLLNYIVPDSVHVMANGRIVQSGGKELALELEANGYADYRGMRGGVRRAWPTITLMKTPAETALAEAFEAAKAALPGDVAPREEAFRLFTEQRPAAPAGRGVQVHRPARRSCARPRPSRPRPRRTRRRRRSLETARFRGVERARRSRSSTAISSREAAGCRKSAGRRRDRAARRGAGFRPSDWLAHQPGRRAARDNPVYQLNSAFMADGVVIRVAAGSSVAARAPALRHDRRRCAVATATRVLVVVEEGASVTLLETHESDDGAEPSAERRGRDRRRRPVETCSTCASTPRATRRSRLSTLAVKLGAHAVVQHRINVRCRFARPRATRSSSPSPASIRRRRSTARR